MCFWSTPMLCTYVIILAPITFGIGVCLSLENISSMSLEKICLSAWHNTLLALNKCLCSE